MIIAVDKAQKDGKHDLKHNQLKELGCELISAPLPVGDYILVDEKVMEVIGRKGEKLSKLSLMGSFVYSIDTKQNCEEIYSDLIGDHKRFRDECILAQRNGVSLTVLIESGPKVMSMEDMEQWHNRKREIIFERQTRRKYGIAPDVDFQTAVADLREHGIRIRPPASGEQLAKAMMTMTEKYGVVWDFCTPQETGRRIYELLQRNNSMILDEDIIALKHAVPMRQLAEYHGIKVNRDGFCICPFHSEKTGSMKIYPGTKGWWCFGGCQTGGDIISFEMRFSNVSFEDAVRNIAALSGFQLHGEDLSEEELSEVRKKAKKQQEERNQKEQQTKRLKAKLNALADRLKYMEMIAAEATPMSNLQVYVFCEMPILQAKYDSLYHEIFKKDR